MEEGPNRAQKQQKVGKVRECYGSSRVNCLVMWPLTIGKWTDVNCLVKSKLILHKIMCQLQIDVHHCLFVYASREPMPSARIQGLPGVEPPDPWLHPNISLGFA